MILIGSARLGETGATNQKAGDASGGEVSTQKYYKHSKGWYCLRAKNEDYQYNLAKAMKDACENNHIGYDQTNRLTLLNELLSTTRNISGITKYVECDCSSLVRACIMIATGKLLGNFNTANEKDVLERSGLFQSAFEVTSPSMLKPGDILVTKTKGHTVIVIETDEHISYRTAPVIDKKFTSIVDALKYIGIDSSFNNRKYMAQLNGISNYKGTFIQNVTLLTKLYSGELKF